ncbi:beta-ketoacyl synthase N-terminal-like domain-containing protein [Streptomyces sp. NPDC018031]|uniref:beta-ketoacyl synthase N-terminal-like domain-containing protein n=1 Tax=Streptomyces sp. NPDC018031 TaxID=3365033 RepID=UPI0037ABBBBD
MPGTDPGPHDRAGGPHDRAAEGAPRTARAPGAEPVAVVGIGLRLPGGNDTPDGFAEFLRAGRSGVGPPPAGRWDPRGPAAEDPDGGGDLRCARGGFLDRPDRFDARFFNISPKEADHLDPQQRLALEVSWEALEDAGIDPGPLRHGRGGVYLAVSNSDYAHELARYTDRELNGYMATGTTPSAVSGRVSYFLGWRGPCITVDTACSASLVAVHLAAQALRCGETDIALAGGVNALVGSRPYVMARRANLLAPDGLCKTFDDAADGYCRAEGGAALVLKRLSDAERDGDRIHAVVRGSAVGSDGESGSLTVPSGPAQEELMRTALASAGLRPHDVSYVEAHGTGTPLGDPIEVGAISAVFGASHSRRNPVAIGSLKTNIGHLESAAGIAGVVKTVLQLRTATYFPHLHFTRPSSRIPWRTAPVTVPTEARPWTAGVRRAMVNSFGLTGSIASVVLEQAPERSAGPGRAPADGGHLLTLSAKTVPALQGQIQRYQRMLRDHPETDLGDLCYSTNVCRAHFGLRLAGVVRDHDDVHRLLERGLSRAVRPEPSGAAKVAFLFPGGGTQYVGMGRPLYERYPVFRAELDACDRLFAPLLGRSVRDVLLGRAADAALVHRVGYMQPALFALEYAVARLWLAWGVRPAVLVGHSAGEIVAATVAGVLTLPDAVTLTAARARLMEAAPPGAMTAVEASAGEAAPLLEGYRDLSVAAVNGPRQLVLSGGTASLAEVERALTGRGIRHRRLAVSCASHSPLMAGAAEELRRLAGAFTFHQPEFTLVSGLTGRVADPAEPATPDYWARHLRETVLFADGLRAVAARGRHTFLEVGPATELTGLGKRCVDDASAHRWLHSLHQEDTDATTVRRTLARLYTGGAAVDWHAHHHGRHRRRITLPGYAFDRRRHWLPPGSAAAPAPSGTAGAHPLLGREVSTGEQLAAGVREFSARLAADRPGYLADHRLLGKVVFPAAGYVEMVLAVQDAVHGETGLPVADLRLHEALLLPEGTAVEVRTRLRTRPDGTGEVTVVSLPGGEGRDGPPLERRHATAALGAGADGPTAVEAALRASAGRAAEPLARHSADDLYAGFAERGAEYGPRFRGLLRAETHDGPVVVAELRGWDPSMGGHLPPAILDSALQSLAALRGEDDVVAVPVGIARCRLLRKPRGGTLRSVLRAVPVGSPAGAGGAAVPAGADLLVLDGDRAVFVLEGLTLRGVTNPAPDRERLYSVLRWERRPPDAPGAAGPRRALLVGADERGAAALAAAATARNVAVSAVATPAEASAPLRERPAEVCWFWRPRRSAEETLRTECERNYRSLLALLDVLRDTGFGRDQRLWLVTAGGQWVPGDRPPHGAPGGAADGAGPPAAATLWGFGPALAAESPGYRVTLVDLPAEDPGGAYPVLLDEWAAVASAEHRVAYRSGLRHVRRLLPGRGGPDGTGDAPAVAEHGRGGGAGPVPPRAEPAPGGNRPGGRAAAGPAVVSGAPGPGGPSAAAPGAGTEPGAGAGADAREVADDGVAPHAPPVAVRPDRTYLITGGFGAPGMLTAEHLAARGARHIALLGRRTPDAAALAALRQRVGPDTELLLYAADLGRAGDVRRVSDALRAGPRPLGGIVHAAGVSAGVAATARTWEDLDTAFRAGVYGSWLLHRAALTHPELEFFIGYGSMAALLGLSGEAGRAAGDAFLDTLLCGRYAAGLPGMSVHWGAWDRTGRADTDTWDRTGRADTDTSDRAGRADTGTPDRVGRADTGARDRAGPEDTDTRDRDDPADTGVRDTAGAGGLGFAFLRPATAMRAVFRLLSAPLPQIGVAEVDWDRVAATRPRPDALYQRVARGRGPAGAGVDLAALLRQPRADRRESVSLVVRGLIAELLHFDGAEDVPPDARFFEVGLDSLAAVELKNALELWFRLPLSASSVFDHPSVGRLGEYIDGRLAAVLEGESR